ncbi:MAG: alpha/beta fold hydrolase [Gemmatimonadota bacterium]
MNARPEFGHVQVAIDGTAVGTVSAAAAYFVRPGRGLPVVYLHGLGSSLRDFANAADPCGLPGRTLLAVDFPGCGRTPAIDDVDLTMTDLLRYVLAVLDRLTPGPVVLVGHSMGGLVALLTAVRRPARVRALVNVEGNLTPDDCFLSRRGANWAGDGFGEHLQGWLRSSGKAGFLCYAERFRDEVSDDVFRAYSRSIVHHSDHDPLLKWFTGLGIPRLFVYGEENDHLGYLGHLVDAGVDTAAIPESNHFPVYSNPTAFFDRLRLFLDRVA